MACLHPQTAYWSKVVNPSGKRSLVFQLADALSPIKVEIKCGQCINCRIQHAAQSAVRCVHEAKSHDVSSFVTLTYSNKNLPVDGGLHHYDFQLFLKRLRARSDFKFKMVMCGEYGEVTNRPHYHALLFGCDFSDRKFYKKTPIGHTLDTSVLLEDCWQLGLCTVGDVTYESCRYVTGYITKKITGPKADDHYMGRRPDYIVWGNGIGKAHFDKYGAAYYDNDFVIVDGKRMKIPRYYDTKFELVDSERLADVKKVRVRKALSRKRSDPDKDTPRRSWTVEQVGLSAIARKDRDYET
ncbi:replication initiator protein [Blackfly microvirus SF02]|uniref:Replication initiator protein n=1 Tax=Blackfly microvirus SF02 TaxID=2576452 RepID=A0A4V1F5H4_9VIRU|nr:replication initiator protein [Blackfly microvirus SF02]